VVGQAVSPVFPGSCSLASVFCCWQAARSILSDHFRLYPQPLGPPIIQPQPQPILPPRTSAHERTQVQHRQTKRRRNSPPSLIRSRSQPRRPQAIPNHNQTLHFGPLTRTYLSNPRPAARKPSIWPPLSAMFWMLSRRAVSFSSAPSECVLDPWRRYVSPPDKISTNS
jgi:hypothetical protein